MKCRKKRSRQPLILGAALALLAAGAARAQTEVAAAAPQPAAAAAAASNKADKSKDDLTALPSAQDFRPTGPMTLSGDHLEAVKGDSSSAVYTGNVVMDSDTLKMDGDRADAKKFADGYTVKITGSPAHMSHAGTGPDNPPVTAQAKVITYDSRTSTIELLGDAVLTKAQEKTTAETIHYNVRDKSYGADRGDNSRVIMIFPPSASAPGAPRGAPTAKPQPPAPAQPQNGAQTPP